MKRKSLRRLSLLGMFLIIAMLPINNVPLVEPDVMMEMSCRSDEEAWG